MKIYKEKTKISNENLYSPLRTHSFLQRKRDLIDKILPKRNASPDSLLSACSVA